MATEQIFAVDEVAQFLASLAPKKVIHFKTSQRAQERLNFLLDKNKSVGLNTDESREMEKYMLVEHLVQLAKAKALLRLVKP